MANGFFLTLLAGPAVPVPVPQVVTDALTSVEVTTTAERDRPSVFRLTFSLSNRSPVQTLFLLAGGAMPPVLRVILFVTIDGTPEVLIDGVVTRQDVSPGSGGSQTTLTVTGDDLTAAMNWIALDGVPFPAMPSEARVALMLAKYALFGIVPLIIPQILSDVPIPTERIPVQKHTDLYYIRQLAEEAGYVFYLTPGPVPGANVAYWGPEVKVGVPQRALNVDMDAHTNVESLSFNFDAESALLPILWVHNSLTKVPIPIPIPDVSLLNPPLGLIPPIPKKLEQLTGVAKRNPVTAALLGVAEEARASDAVSGTGSLDVLRYGRPLKARGLVGVRGVGTAFDGLYFVQSVTHKIKRGEYKQDFTLTRNGLVSTLPRVPA
jgi:hypothetical protein